ncbi:hypothetical protein [Mycobacteroides abscessus]|uniref:hypothetical protein n=1 Tax=Mycobacteroides abscessus TaxID=36809 RepID=UPI000C25A0A3|nr:hypothetical protein [Mycobacteroides abscessus]
MSHVITTGSGGYQLHVPACGAGPLVYAEPDIESPLGRWWVHGEGIAEHLDAIPVADADAARTALEMIGYAYDAGGGA